MSHTPHKVLPVLLRLKQGITEWFLGLCITRQVSSCLRKCFESGEVSIPKCVALLWHTKKINRPQKYCSLYLLSAYWATILFLLMSVISLTKREDFTHINKHSAQITQILPRNWIVKPWHQFLPFLSSKEKCFASLNSSTFCKVIKTIGGLGGCHVVK